MHQLRGTRQTAFAKEKEEPKFEVRGKKVDKHTSTQQRIEGRKKKKLTRKLHGKFLELGGAISKAVAKGVSGKRGRTPSRCLESRGKNGNEV